jgi:GNAT superfamily N-acetyltransferase
MLERRADPAAIADEMRCGVRWLCAASDGALVAYASHAAGDGPLARPGDWKLRQLYVAAAHRHHGLGRALCAAVRDAAVAAGAGMLILAVNRRNAGAIAAYARLGFRVRGDACTAIGGGFAMDDHILELPLR